MPKIKPTQAQVQELLKRLASRTLQQEPKTWGSMETEAGQAFKNLPAVERTPEDIKSLVESKLGRSVGYGESLHGPEQLSAANEILNYGGQPSQENLMTKIKDYTLNALTGRPASTPMSEGTGYVRNVPLDVGQRLTAQNPMMRPFRVPTMAGGAPPEARVVAPVEPSSPNELLGGLQFYKEKFVPAQTTAEEQIMKEALSKTTPAGQNLPFENLKPKQLSMVRAIFESKDAWKNFGTRSTNRGSLEKLFKGDPKNNIPPVAGARGHTSIEDFFEEMFFLWRTNPAKFKESYKQMARYFEAMSKNGVFNSTFEKAEKMFGTTAEILKAVGERLTPHKLLEAPKGVKAMPKDYMEGSETIPSLIPGEGWNPDVLADQDKIGNLQEALSLFRKFKKSKPKEVNYEAFNKWLQESSKAIPFIPFLSAFYPQQQQSQAFNW